MEGEVIEIEALKLVGMEVSTSFAADKTAQLWSSFMPQRKLIKNALSTDLYSVNLYPSVFSLENFSPQQEFTKWAVVPVSSHNEVPSEMKAYQIEAGKYARFKHIGPAHTFPKTMAFILGEWLPQNNLEVDDRPHFEVLQPGYNPMDKNAKEWVYIPVKC